MLNKFLQREEFVAHLVAIIYWYIERENELSYFIQRERTVLYSDDLSKRERDKDIYESYQPTAVIQCNERERKKNP